MTIKVRFVELMRTWKEQSKEYRNKILNKRRVIEIFEQTIDRTHNVRRLKEELTYKDFKQLEELRLTNPKFKSDTDRLLKDLPEVCKYSFEPTLWDNYQDYSLWELYETYYGYLSSRGLELLTSDYNDDILWWVCLEQDLGSKIPKTIWGVKFGSFNPDGNSYLNIEFFRQIFKYLDQRIPEYNRIYWTANINYPFVRHYIKLIKKYKGYVKRSKEDSDTIEFLIGAPFIDDVASLSYKELDDTESIRDLDDKLKQLEIEVYGEEL